MLLFNQVLLPIGFRGRSIFFFIIVYFVFRFKYTCNDFILVSSSSRLNLKDQGHWNRNPPVFLISWFQYPSLIAVLRYTTLQRNTPLCGILIFRFVRLFINLKLLQAPSYPTAWFSLNINPSIRSENYFLIQLYNCVLP